MNDRSDATLILLGSARGDGHTGAAVRRLSGQLERGARVIDLASATLAPFRYEAAADDDFLSIVAQIQAHGRIVFATPVYWYAMSGLMKTFFDRITDLLLDPRRQPVARSLAGRSAWLLATGSGEHLPAGFAEPFSGTCHYLDIRWRGAFYARVGTGAPCWDEIDILAAQVQARDGGGP